MSDQAQTMGELAEVARELGRHLLWAREQGERELPAAPKMVHPAGGQAAAARAVAMPTSMAPASMSSAQAASASMAPTSAGQAVARRRERSSERERAQGACVHCEAGASDSEVLREVELVFVSEWPEGGEPGRRAFEGEAGALFDKMLEAMGQGRQSVHLSYLLPCGQAGASTGAESACEPLLRARLESLRPRAIVVLGQQAAQLLLDVDTPIAGLRGRWHRYRGIPLMPSFHPAYLALRPSEKGKAWEDLKLVMAESS